MRSNRWLAGLSLVLALGCVESRPAVNRVQPNVTRKADLISGEWYFLQTVVDTPYSTDFTFVGEQGTLERVRWEVQRDFLVARRSYEYINGAEGEGINGSTDTEGAPIAMYRIEKHFDIRREFNSVTGEQYNVIVENDTDLPWNEQPFMRVDWSENLITNPNFLMLQRYFDSIETESVSWFVQDPNDPNAPTFVRQDPTDEASPLAYMDITNKMFVRPTTIQVPGLRDGIPSCFVLSAFDGNAVDCTAGEITVRNSFMRVESRDYQPTVYTGDRMERAGYFITERPGYDRQYGLVEPARYRFANRHNIWETSHRAAADGSPIRCTTNADCGAGMPDDRGSVCDLDLGRSERRITDDRVIEGACTVPFRDRTIRPIVYYTSSNFPEDMIPDARFLSDQWNSAYVDTVASLRANECAAHGGGDCASERTRSMGERVFVLCQSPVPMGADPACGEPGTIARIGDLRYSLLGYVSEPHRSSPLGYGPSAANPINGEIVMANAFLYGAGVDTYSAFGRDILRLLNGDLAETDVTSNVPVDAWVRHVSAMTEGGHERAAQEHAVAIDGLDVPRIAAAMDFSWVPRTGRNVDRGAPADPGAAMERLSASMQRLNSSGAFGNGLDEPHARLSRLVGTDIEQMLTTGDMRMMAGVDPSQPLDEATLNAASPLRGMSFERMAAIQRLRDRIQQSQGLDYGDFAEDGLLGLARAVQNAASTGGSIEWNGVQYNLISNGHVDYEAVRNMLRHPILTGLALHEVGHTLGLRHNFSGSYDAVNFGSHYWDLRDDGSMQGRAWDPMTDAEVNGRIREYQYSTVMDYGNNFVTTDAMGIGHYDRFAIKLGYGDLIEVFETVPNATEVAWNVFFQDLGWPFTLSFNFVTGGASAPITTTPYTDWPRLVGGRANLEHRVDVPYTDLRNETTLAASRINARVADSQGRIMVPYRFCSDEQADLGPTCQRYDAGADPYETTQSIIDSYWNYYIFTNYRRRRLGFNVQDTATRVHDRFFEKMSRANQQFALYRPIVTDTFGDSPAFDTFFERPDGMGAFTAAVGAGYGLLTRVITAPEPGGYTQGARGDGSQAMLPGGTEMRVDGFDGRFLETTWDFSAGYFWFDQLDRVGYFYDKVAALEVLTDPTTHFIGRDTDADIRRYQLNFASTFGPSVTRFFGGLLGEDWSRVAPRMQGTSLVYPDPGQIVDGSMPGVPISPNASFSIELFAAVYGMSFIPQTYDQEFLNHSRVWVRGGAEEVAIDPSLPLVTYTDRDSGLTYAAVSYHDANGHETGVGAQLIVRAQALQARAASDEVARSELRSFVDNLDIIRRLTWHLGFGAQP